MGIFLCDMYVTDTRFNQISTIVIMRHFQGAVAVAALLLFAISTALGADGKGKNSIFTVKGIVTDSVGTGESFATLRVFAEGDSLKAAAMGVADVDGVFSLPLPAAGTYDLTVSAVGKEDIERTFEVTAAKPVFDLGTLTAVTASNILGEVTVTAQRPVVMREIDRIGYDVQADDDSKTVNLDEILKKVPLVTVDPDGTIKVKGSTDFKIYKNNRPNNSFTKNAKDIFKAIPASMIKKIEVITDPGAREDAEGVGVILNIVTLENTVIKGVMGNVSANWNSANRTPSGNLWITSQIDKVTFSFSGGYNHSSRRASKSHSEMFRRYEESGDEMHTLSESAGSGNMGWINGDASYELDSLNLFTMELGGFFYRSKNDGFTTTRMMSGENLLYKYTRHDLTDPYGYADFNGNFNYQHSTRRKGETLTLSYAISTTKQNQTADGVYDEIVNAPMPYTGTHNDFDLRYIEQTVQADWTRPINEHNKFDVGGKFVHRKNHSISTNEYIGAPEMDTHSDFSHLTTIGALYADYRLNLGHFGARAGVRYEYSHLAAKYLDGAQDPFGSDLNDVVPNAALSWNINDANSLKISYGTSISRPGINYLNPIRTETPSSVSYGNPRLGSARVQSFNLNYGLISSKVNIDFNSGYSFSNNGIISSMWTGEDNITYSTYANGGRTRNFNAGLYFQWTVTPKTSFMTNASLRYMYQRNPSLKIHAEGWSGYAWGRIQQKLPWKLTANLSLNYWSGFKSLYGDYTNTGISAINYSISLRRAFLKEDRLNVNVSVNNPVGPSKSRTRNVENNTGYYGESISVSNFRKSVWVSVSWRFGNLNASVKKTAATISNDDLDGQRK